MGIGVVVVGLGDGRAHGGSGVMQELVLKPHGHAGDGLALGLRQLGPRCEKSVEFTLANLIGMDAKLLEQDARVSLMDQPRVACGRLAIDDHKRGLDPLATLKLILLGLGAQIVDVIENHLVKVADPRIKIARRSDVQDQRQTIPSRSLHAMIPIQGHNRLGRRRRADHKVGGDERIVHLLERHGPSAPTSSNGSRSPGVAIDHENLAGIQPLEPFQRELPHLARAQHQHGLIAERIKDAPGDVDGHAGDRKLSLVHAGSFANQLADLESRLKNRVKNWPHRLALHGHLIGLADLAQDLTLAEHQAFDAGSHAKQMADDPLIVVTDQMIGEDPGVKVVKLSDEIGQGAYFKRGFAGACRVNLDPVAGRENREFTVGESAREEIKPGRQFGLIKGEGLTKGSRRGSVIDADGQQSHGLAILPAGQAEPWAVGR